MSEQKQIVLDAIEALYAAFLIDCKSSHDSQDCPICVSPEGEILIGGLIEPKTINEFSIIHNNVDVVVTGQLEELPVHSMQHHYFIKFFPTYSFEDEIYKLSPNSFLIKDQSGQQIEKQRLNLKNIFTDEIVERMTSHMNEDHIDAMQDYCRYKKIHTSDSPPTMLNVDQYGFDLLVKHQPYRIMFDSECADPQQVREALVDLAKKSRAE